MRPTSYLDKTKKITSCEYSFYLPPLLLVHIISPFLLPLGVFDNREKPILYLGGGVGGYEKVVVDRRAPRTGQTPMRTRGSYAVPEIACIGNVALTRSPCY